MEAILKYSVAELRALGLSPQKASYLKDLAEKSRDGSIEWGRMAELWDLGARELRGVPLKWVEDRAEHLQAAAHARDHRYLMKVGFSEQGKITAVQADVTCNIGAYSVYPWTAGIEPLMAGGLLIKSVDPLSIIRSRASARAVEAPPLLRLSVVLLLN